MAEKKNFLVFAIGIGVMGVIIGGITKIKKNIVKLMIIKIKLALNNL